jgi:5-methylthioadenosine/S-adenosylhomocysteine deaminase
MTSAPSTDRIVSGKYLLPTHRQDDCISNGAVAISGDTILATGTREELKTSFPNFPELHEEHGLIMPGLVNSHTHAAMTCFRGLADDLPLMTWLNDHIFPVEAKLNSEMVFYSSLLSLAEMIKGGTTSFCDMYLFAKDVARATEIAGVRGWIGEVLYDFPSPNYGDPANGFIYLQEMLDQYKYNSLITTTVDPHSVYTCSPDLLKKLSDIAEKSQSLYHIHLSENQAEVQTCQERYNCTPVAHLENLGVLSERTLAAHCVVLDDADIQLLAKRGVKIAHCIESNMKLASGIAPISKMLESGISISIGTDGSASNNDTDMFSEMNSVAKIHKVSTSDPTVMNAETTLYTATMGGAKSLGVEHSIGSLVEGKKADLIVLDLNQPHLTPLYNIPSHLVYAANGNDVIHSFINGRQVLDNRILTTIDEKDLLERMTKMGQTIQNMN